MGSSNSSKYIASVQFPTHSSSGSLTTQAFRLCVPLAIGTAAEPTVVERPQVIAGVRIRWIIVLVFALSLRLRQSEIDTIFKLSCSRLTIVRLVGAQIGMILLASGLSCRRLLVILNHSGAWIVRRITL